MVTAYIALGTNLGDKQQNLSIALEKMQQQGLSVQKISNFVTTAPYGSAATQDFLNAVCQVLTDLEPEQLLVTLKTIEKQMGRTKVERWGNRLIDLDIILYDNITYKSEKLTIPHQDMLKRLFVLEPLMQITSSNFILPNNKTIAKQIKILKEC